MSEFAVETANDVETPPPMLAEAGEAAPAEKADKKVRVAHDRESRPMQEMRTNEDRNLKDWLEDLSPGTAIRVKVVRTNPKLWKGLNVGGNLATYDQQIDEDFIRETHGGGDYFLTVSKPKTNGTGWVYAGGKVVKIAGDPRTDDVFRDKSGEAAVGVPSQPNNSLADRVMTSMERQLERAQEQGKPRGPDTEMLKLLMAPMQQQINQMSEMVRQKDHQLIAMQTQASAQPRQPHDEFRDKMISSLMDVDSVRVNALRTQFESEIRQLKQSGLEDIKRFNDNFERERDRIERAHERELNSIKSANDMKVLSQDTLAGATRTLMEGEIRRLQADLTEAKSELVSLRAKKDKSILEQASEFAAIKEAIGDITGGDEKDEKSGLEKVMEVVGNLPILQQAVSKMGGGDPQAAQQAAAQQAATAQRASAPRLATGADGHLYRILPDGTPHLVRRRGPAPKPGEAAAAPEIPAATVKIAVDYLESAFRNGHEAADVATSVRSMIPADILTSIRARGIDAFLTEVAKLDGTSPLSGQAGRNWTRKLGKALLEG